MNARRAPAQADTPKESKIAQHNRDVAELAEGAWKEHIKTHPDHELPEDRPAEETQIDLDKPALGAFRDPEKKRQLQQSKREDEPNPEEVNNPVMAIAWTWINHPQKRTPRDTTYETGKRELDAADADRDRVMEEIRDKLRAAGIVNPMLLERVVDEYNRAEWPDNMEGPGTLRVTGAGERAAHEKADIIIAEKKGRAAP